MAVVSSNFGKGLWPGIAKYYSNAYADPHMQQMQEEIERDIEEIAKHMLILLEAPKSRKIVHLSYDRVLDQRKVVYDNGDIEYEET